MIFVEAGPGQGPSLHTHPYVEIHVAQAGEALFIADGEERVVRAGEIAVVPAGVPHSFEARERGFSEIAIHVNGHFVTEWLSGDS
jgi:quercetin dioxygenase-like cupin family protein